MSQLASDPALQALQDRLEIEDTIYRYASRIDRRDLEGIRATLADDIRAQYGNSEPLVGGDAVLGFIDEATKDCAWQHHLLSVYHVDVEGDTATALVYHTSYQGYHGTQDVVHQIVARYHDELRRESDGWRITRLVFEILWAERRSDPSGYLAEIGGRGPVLDVDWHRRDGAAS
jgi:ketosteroid isomerase-like protein